VICFFQIWTRQGMCEKHEGMQRCSKRAKTHLRAKD
jgi:hypothetical protein